VVLENPEPSTVFIASWISFRYQRCGVTCTEDVFLSTCFNHPREANPRNDPLFDGFVGINAKIIGGIGVPQENASKPVALIPKIEIFLLLMLRFRHSFPTTWDA